MKRVYLFEEGSADMRDLLGGKGANLAEMTNIGLPVPPGFTITTDVCRGYMKRQRLPDGLMHEVREKMQIVEGRVGKKFGDPDNPLLVSVRSGAKFSMPGMMDTILNLGLNDATAAGMVKLTQNPRFVYDAYRRFVMMFSDVVMDIPKRLFEERFEALKHRLGVKQDTEVPADALKELVQEFKQIVRDQGKEFPEDPYQQLEMAIEAVFRSWNNERAVIYREREKIPHDLGTACNVQAMVFGNMGDDSGTGVAFTRNPSTGERELYGEFLPNAQGEDVVAGVRTPLPLSALHERMPEVYQQFLEIADRLERHYRDMMDLEFTVERGRLWMLQCRVGKRTGRAAVKIAVDMAQEGLIGRDEAVLRVQPSHLDQLLHPYLDESALATGEYPLLAQGLGASPGAASGRAVFDAKRAMEQGKHEPVILVRPETNPDDVGGMLASKGILTARGGMTSHAAVVARGFGIPCVAGCEAISVDEHENLFTVEVNGETLTVREGDYISIDGSTGKVYKGAVPTQEPELSPELHTLLKWADEFRRLRVRANADTPHDAAKALEFGAEGIGLARTEHMFFGEQRLPIMQEMILAKTEKERREALGRLLPFQRQDFFEIFEVMQGLPVTIRLIDPPLHEFLPRYEDLIRETTQLEITAPDSPELAEKRRLLQRVEELHEANPMLGLRGVRLSLLYPEIVEMQVTAILEAAAEAARRDYDPHVEILIPLVGHVNELKLAREHLERVAKEVMEREGVRVDYKFGTMIEIPRAALTADEIAQYAQFFSFGTNDLTQTTFGYSRDDAEGKFLAYYVEHKILPENPFVTLDRDGVGKLIRMAFDLGRAVRPDLKVGICGEHGGDPDSIAFCHEVGLDYVSCSPFRVPIARLAAAQAALRKRVQIAVDK
ncbi:MAG: pyruvate, phosphate dikinase [Fimbriimonadales bacterium]|nr:MAG: pyruvate, phosphate dikinase [Fimbriimonadales bacterium]